MEMQLGITIDKIVTKLKLAEGRDDDIKAFGELWIHILDQEEPIFKVKGFTIRHKDFRGKKVFNVVFPGFRSGKGFQSSFVAESKALWKDILILFLQEFGELTGGLGAEDIASLQKPETEELTDAQLDEIATGIEEQYKNQ